MRLAVLLSLALTLVVASAARAELLPVQTLDGPSSDIVALDGVAMAQDGTGGLVYRRRVDGHVHVFASRFFDGAWTAPQRVDNGQQFDSSWPAIAAGDGGRLVVTWAQPFSPGVDALWSAALDPGARSFQAPFPIDEDIGDATATFPSLAMNPGGRAYIVYRVETNPTGTGLPSGYVGAQLRLARYDGEWWSGISALANRDPAQGVPKATAANAPKIGVDVSGNGLVAFDEPDDDFIDRIWARRIFGASVGNPLLVSPPTWNGKPLLGGADSLALSEEGLGAGAVAFVQSPGPGSTITQPRVMAAEIPESSDTQSGRFAAPRIVDGTPATGTTPGALSVSNEPGGSFATGYGVGDGSWLGGGDTGSVDAPDRLDDGSVNQPGSPQVDVSDGGAASQAWNENGAVAIREVTADGVSTTTRVASTDGGTVGELRLAGSGLGDAVIAFRQGNGSAQEIAATAIDAAPEPFIAETPLGWVRSKRTTITWDDAQNALGPVTYSITVDDEDTRDDLTKTKATLGASDLPDGRDHLVVIATDRLGQQSESDDALIKVDRTPPKVKVTKRGRRVTVRVTDRLSGVRKAKLSVKFGAGKPSHKTRATHVYGPGRYTIVVRAGDKAGNYERVRRRVTVK